MNRRGETEMVVYGRRSVLEALEVELVEVERVAVARNEPADFRKTLRAACGKRDVPLTERERSEIGALSRAPQYDQGVVAIIRLLGVIDAEEFVETLKGARAKEPTRLIALDNVTNPQNVGMIVRSALALGMSGIVWPTVGTPWIGGLVIKSSAATVYRLPVVRCESLVEGLWMLKRHGFTLVGLTADGASDLSEHTAQHRAVYIVGGETEGISDEVEEVLDERVAISMSGGVESLNAAVAASLVCFSVGRGSSDASG